MKKTHLIAAMLLLAPYAARGQSVTPQVISASGGHWQGAGNQVSWTLGETVIQTLSAGGNILTQGFHQPEIKLTGLPDHHQESGTISAFPNPVSSRVTVNFSGLPEGDYTIAITDIRGRMLSSHSVMLAGGEQQFPVDFSGLADATYVLEVHKKDNSVHKAIRIIKTTE